MGVVAVRVGASKDNIVYISLVSFPDPPCKEEGSG